MDAAATLLRSAIQHQRAGRLVEAEDLYRELLRREPRHPEALNNLGVVCVSRGRADEARAHYERAIRARPDFPDALVNLGQLFGSLGQFDEALPHLRRAVDLTPSSVDARTLLGATLVSSDRPEEAIPVLRAVVDGPSPPALAHTNLGVAYEALNRSTEAIACFDAALAIRPDDPLAHFNRGVSWLASGDYTRGWAEFEWRWRNPQFFGRSLADDGRRWDGTPLEGRTLLLYTEQGFGDAIQMLRFVSVLRASGARVIIRCGPSLAPLLRESMLADEVVTADADLPPFDVHAALMSLPHLLGVRTEAIPGHVPYLQVATERRARWDTRLEHLAGRRVGICWQGNPSHPKNTQRSMALAHFLPLARIPGLSLVSLQHELADAPSPHAAFVSPHDLGITRFDFAETAGAISALDLVITVDTVTAHLAGALGRPVWILLPFAPDWRWMRDRPDTPWYPTARLWRQARRGDWDGVLRDVTAALGPWAAR